MTSKEDRATVVPATHDVVIEAALRPWLLLLRRVGAFLRRSR